MSNRSRLRPVFHPAAAGTLALTLLAAHPAGAQATLSLSPAVSSASMGQSVTFTVLMNDTATNTGDYDFFINLPTSPTYLSFASTGFTFSPTSPFSAFPGYTISGSQMEVSAGAPLAGGGVGGFAGTALGTFTVLVNSVPTTPTVTQVAFGTIGTGAGQSQVNPYGSSANQLTAITPAALTLLPAPEPSQTAALGLGVLGLVGLALRARRMKKDA